MSELEDRLEALADNYNLPSITEWRQGHFVDKPQYRSWSEEQRKEAESRERTLVRPYWNPNNLSNALFQVSGTDRDADVVEYLEALGALLKEIQND